MLALNTRHASDITVCDLKRKLAGLFYDRDARHAYITHKPVSHKMAIIRDKRTPAGYLLHAPLYVPGGLNGLALNVG